MSRSRGWGAADRRAADVTIAHAARVARAAVALTVYDAVVMIRRVEPITDAEWRATLMFIQRLLIFGIPALIIWVIVLREPKKGCRDEQADDEQRDDQP